MRRPWLKFYPADWQSDQALRLVGLEARGLWLECMCIMHRADPYGHLVVNGRPVTDAQLAVLAGTSPDRVPALMAELATAGVFSRNRAGVVYSRRMTRDEKRSKDGETAKITGKSVPGSRRHQASEKSGDNVTTFKVVDKVVEQPPSPQKPDARVKGSSLTGASRPADIARLMLDIWAEECRGVLRVPNKLTPDRIKACGLRWNDTFGKEPDEWRSHCRAIVSRPFLCGENDRRWQADFDWALTPKGILRLQEGKYDLSAISRIERGSAEIGNAKLRDWALADDEQEGFRGHH